MLWLQLLRHEDLLHFYPLCNSKLNVSSQRKQFFLSHFVFVLCCDKLFSHVIQLKTNNEPYIKAKNKLF